MTPLALAPTSSKSIPIWDIQSKQLSSIKTMVSAQAATWAKANEFEAKAGQVCVLADQNGKLSGVLFGTGDGSDERLVGNLPKVLPQGKYAFQGSLASSHAAALSWVLGAYSFDRYTNAARRPACLSLAKGLDRGQIELEAKATFLARDLINTPANDLGPEALEKEARKLAKAHKATVSVIKGDDLLKKNFPMIHAVGRASTSAPRLIDIKWGPARCPKVTLVGKGVIFDTGGLNIKPGASMALMKKDMGGAANVLALAQMIMEAGLKVRLRVLVPAVENAISGNAFRPGDILPSRKGITVEIGNTDAEGRLILGDALALGDEEKPDLMIDMATLTGAARVALGPDLPPYYTNDDALAEAIQSTSTAQNDPLWRMPLWPGYKKMLSSKIADINHISTGGFAGSITAALFLSRFVDDTKAWVHFDIFGWVPSAKPWAPVGGEAQGIRALFYTIKQRFNV